MVALSRTSKPSPEAEAALRLCQVLERQVAVLQAELRGARRLAAAAFGLAASAIGVAGTLAFA